MNPGTGKTVALTGATGFLGSHIADCLLAAGWTVRASVRPTSDRRWQEGKAVTLVETDLSSAESCRGFLDQATAVVHCAGVVSARDDQAYRAGNVTTTRVLLETAAELWGRGAPEDPVFILISSLAAHGPAGLDEPAREDAPCLPITAYGRSKLEAEGLINGRDWPFRTVILRPPGLYGPRDRDFLPLFKAARLGFTARLGRVMQGLSLVDGRDAAAATVALLQAPDAQGVYFVDDGHTGYDFSELAAALGTALDRKVRLLTVPLGLMAFIARVVGSGRAARSPVLNPDRMRDLNTPGWVCDGARLRKDTGFVARFDLPAGFTDTVRHLKEQGLL
jgi:nucleoside-diphosphate-sugar epimerase